MDLPWVTNMVGMHASAGIVVEALWRLSGMAESRAWLLHTVIKVRSCEQGGLLSIEPIPFSSSLPHVGVCG